MQRPSFKDVLDFEEVFGVSLDRFHSDSMRQGLVPFDFDLDRFDSWLHTKGDREGIVTNYVEKLTEKKPRNWYCGYWDNHYDNSCGSSAERGE